MHETIELAAQKADLYRDLGDLLNDDLHELAEEGHDYQVDRSSESIWLAAFIKMRHMYY